MSRVELFAELERLLVEAIPKSIKSLELNKTVCSLFIYYYDGHAPCTYLLLQPMYEEWRQNVCRSTVENLSWKLWFPSSHLGNAKDVGLPREPPISKIEYRIEELFEQVYEWECDPESETDIMIPFRETLQKVSLQLNSLSWDDICLVTDDFVVVPSDGSAHFMDYEDIKLSIPEEKRQLLMDRGLYPQDL